MMPCNYLMPPPNREVDPSDDEQAKSAQSSTRFLSDSMEFANNGNTSQEPIRPRRSAKLHRSGAMKRKISKPSRLVRQDGEFNIETESVPSQYLRYFTDIFTTLLDMKWRWCFLLFCTPFLTSWVLFGFLWWGVAFLNGDTLFTPEQAVIENRTEPFCVENVYNFPSAFLFSMETQTTIGYGFRHTTAECPHAIILICLQSIWGCLVEAFLVGFIFTKLARPAKRAATLLFSRYCAISRRDGKLCLAFRVGDMRNSHLLTATVRGLLIKPYVTREGEVLPLYQNNVTVELECGDNQVFLFWPLIMIHPIDEDSPFYEMSLNDLRSSWFEFIIILEGTVEATGMTVQARTSYIPQEILWGRKFEPLMGYHNEGGTYKIDFSRFHTTVPDQIPACSAKDLYTNEKYKHFMTDEKEQKRGFNQLGNWAPQGAVGQWQAAESVNPRGSNLNRVMSKRLFGGDNGSNHHQNSLGADHPADTVTET